MKICMVGTGRMAEAHSQAFAEIPDAHLHTAINLKAEHAHAFKTRYGYERGVTSLDEALAQGGFDTVVITTPNQLHFDQCVAALRADKHVLCELPLALSLGEVETLGRLAREHDRRLMVCHTERFQAGRMELHRRVVAGELHPKHVFGRFYMLRRGQMKTAQSHHGWDDNVLWHHGCHVMDAIMDIIGPHEALDLHAQFGPVWPSLGIPLDVDLTWRAISSITGEEVLVSVSLSHNARWLRHDYHVIGEEDDYLVDDHCLSNSDGVLADEAHMPGRVLVQDREFAAAVREGRAPLLDVPAALPTIRIVQAAWDQWLATQ
jgi:2-hydroxy-4-carboxymuconate semialdehyde hemiacetal dehydrogenase